MPILKISHQSNKKIKNFYKRRAGFSLIELVIVVAVLTVLGSIALPRFGDITRKARQVAASTHVNALLKSASMYKAYQGSLPTTWEQILQYYSGGNSGSNFDTCNLYGSVCNGNERVIIEGQYLITFFVDNDKFGVSAWRFNNTGPTSRNLSVMGCLSSSTGGSTYLFSNDGYWQGQPWNEGILDDNGNALNLCG